MPRVGGIEAKDAAADGSTFARAWGWVLFMAALACAPAQGPCLAPSDCSSGRECLAHRCLPQGAEPVPKGSARVVVEPTLSAVVRESGLGGDLPATVTFGGPAPLNQQLLLRFPEAWAHLEVEAAFLLLHPATEAAPSGSDVPVRVSLAGAPWSGGVVGHAPVHQAPESMGVARTRPATPLRIDVTAQVRALQTRTAHGLLLRGAATVSRGATYLTGADGLGPRLDVYGRPSTRRR